MAMDAERSIEVYLPLETLKALDAWIAEQPMPFSRAEAVRAIVGATLDLMGGFPTAD